MKKGSQEVTAGPTQLLEMQEEQSELLPLCGKVHCPFRTSVYLTDLFTSEHSGSPVHSFHSSDGGGTRGEGALCFIHTRLFMTCSLVNSDATWPVRSLQGGQLLATTVTTGSGL